VEAYDSRPAPGVSARSRQLMKKSPVTGLLVVALGDLAKGEGLQDADIITSFAGVRTPDPSAYFKAHVKAHDTKGVAPLTVHRDAKTVTFDADRRKISRDFGGVRTAAVKKGKSSLPRPPANVRKLTGVLAFESWFAWEAQPYKEGGRFTTKGFEHYVVAVGKGVVSLRAEIVFDQFGLHSQVATESASASDGRARSAVYVLEAPKFTVSTSGTSTKTSWKVDVIQKPDERRYEYTGAIDFVPSLFARFVPSFMPRKPGAAFAYTPAPQNPLSLHELPRTVVCTGKEDIDWGRRKPIRVRRGVTTTAHSDSLSPRRGPTTWASSCATSSADTARPSPTRTASPRSSLQRCDRDRAGAEGHCRAAPPRDSAPRPRSGTHRR